MKLATWAFNGRDRLNPCGSFNAKEVPYGQTLNIFIKIALEIEGKRES